MANGTCSIEGCNGVFVARGRCESHYRKWKREHPETRSVRCSYPGCGSPHAAKGWCTKHYQRWVRTGDPRGNGRNQDLTEAERFFQKVDFDFATGCWCWTAYISDKGYGRFRFGGRQGQAHRWAYQDAHHVVGWNEAPDLRFDPDNGMVLCRRCHGRLHAEARR